jgi:phage-related protein
LNETVDAELEALPADMSARFEYVGRLSRAIYVTATVQRVVVVRVFVKKTQKTPGSEIELALQRAKEIRR